MKTRHLALLSAFFPFAALVGGCGGGGSNGPSTTPTPAPTFIGPSTGTPNFPTITVPATYLLLPSGQIALLNLKRTGGNAEGTLRVFNGTASDDSVGAGLYNVSGAFATSNAFSVQNLATDNRFTLSGNLPKDGRNGGFNFRIGRSSGAGLLLAPDATAFPGSAPYTTVGDLQFSNFTSSDATATAPISVTPTGPAALTGSPTTGVFGYEISGNNISPRLDLEGARSGLGGSAQQLSIFTSVSPAPAAQANPNLLSAGQTFDLTSGVRTSGATPSLFIGYAGRNYFSNSGTLTIQSIGIESITLRFNNVTVATRETPASSFVVNGTFTVPVGVLTAIRIL